MALPALTTTQGDALAARLKVRLGNRFRDKRTTIRRHPGWNVEDQNYFVNVDAAAMPWLVFHYSAGLPGPVSSESIADHHVGTNGWPGPGYHLVIDEGFLDYIGDINTQRAHIKGLNDKGIGTCFTGLYDNTLPAAADIEVARILVAELDDFFGHKKEIKGHWHVNGRIHTPCPGRIVEILPTLRSLPEKWTPDDAARLSWRLEQLARARRGDGPSRDALIASLYEPPDQGEHDLIVERALPPVHEERA